MAKSLKVIMGKPDRMTEWFRCEDEMLGSVGREKRDGEEWRNKVQVENNMK